MRKMRKKATATRTVKGRHAVVWFTGLSGSGKSTIADWLAKALRKKGVDIERLDGDQIRNCFPGTGFGREDREEHLKRVGWVASLLEKHGVTVIATFVSPYISSRKLIRQMCRNFVEVYVSTPLEECERRDVKGLYKKARAGVLKNFTGIDDPYEAPRKPEITIDTTGMSVAEAGRLVLEYLMKN
ncbi:MAG: adenylyl-sulfate kinase [Verrucomicrobia bacterium]|nr:adenylyl-sulfate kinase [Verrucomicrobiota bacterium]